MGEELLLNNNILCFVEGFILQKIAEAPTNGFIKQVCMRLSIRCCGEHAAYRISMPEIESILRQKMQILH
jgi:hypothetical protein